MTVDIKVLIENTSISKDFEVSMALVFISKQRAKDFV